MRYIRITSMMDQTTYPKYYSQDAHFFSDNTNSIHIYFQEFSLLNAHHDDMISWTIINESTREHFPFQGIVYICVCLILFTISNDARIQYTTLDFKWEHVKLFSCHVQESSLVSPYIKKRKKKILFYICTIYLSVHRKSQKTIAIEEQFYVWCTCSVQKCQHVHFYRF